MKPFDLQVNGYAGVDFNGHTLTAEQLHQACAALQADGAGGILATFITDSLEAMSARMARLVALRERDPLAREMIVGIHIEGPFLNAAPGYIGAHPPAHARPAKVDDAQRLLDAAGGLAKLVTLAPENDLGLETTRFLANAGVVVSAGHCDPTLEQLRAAVDAGLSMFTHVGNGCPMQLPRHDNIIQRALHLAGQLWLCFIPDGVHIPFMALANYLRQVGWERAIMVSDAIAAASLGPGVYSLGSWKEVVIGEDLVARAPDASHFIGSTVTWPRALANLRALGYPEAQIARMTAINPRRALGLPVSD